METLRYYFEDGSLVIFDKYTIDTNGIIRNKTGKVVKYFKDGKYNRCVVYDTNGKTHGIRICRAIASTFHGNPMTSEHTADHIDRNPENDTIGNIRWLCKSEQVNNRIMPTSNKSAFIIVRYNVEKTAQDWVEHLKTQKNPFGREYTTEVIGHYARNKQDGFAYKKYPDLQNEVWKEIADSKKDRGYWEISNMNRVKYITEYGENVLSGERLGMTSGGYPHISLGKCHILAFKTFFPKEYASKKPWEIVKHVGDNKLDFRPHNLRIGTQSENVIEGHDNGKRDGTMTARIRCVSYIDGVVEKEHDSQRAAVEYLKLVGYKKATHVNIGKVLSGERKHAYKRTWENVI